jgi:hypothetical protein
MSDIRFSLRSWSYKDFYAASAAASSAMATHIWPDHYPYRQLARRTILVIDLLIRAAWALRMSAFLI